MLLKKKRKHKQTIKLCYTACCRWLGAALHFSLWGASADFIFLGPEKDQAFLKPCKYPATSHLVQDEHIHYWLFIRHMLAALR